MEILVHGLRRMLQGGAIVAILGCLPGALAYAAPSAGATLRQVDAALHNASAQDVPLFAPGRFAEATRLYQAAAAALRAKRDEQAIASAQQALKTLDDATATAARARELLKDAAGARSLALGLDPSMLSRVTDADRLLQQEVQLARLRRSGLRDAREGELQEQVSALRESLYAKSCEVPA